MLYNGSMKKHIKNLFSSQEVEQLSKLIDYEKSKRTIFVWDEFAGEPFPQDVINDESQYIHNVSLGKIRFNFEVPKNIIDKLNNVAKENELDATYFCATYTEYSGKYGRPNLLPHKDNMNFCLIDYQLFANTSWPLNIDDVEYDLLDNEAIAFLPAQLTHGRIDREFTDNDIVKMIFFDMKLNSDLEENK